MQTKHISCIKKSRFKKQKKNIELRMKVCNLRIEHVRAGKCRMKCMQNRKKNSAL